jgi:alkylhydroperoxidase family enzyme
MTFVPDLGPEEFAPDVAYAVTGPDGELRRTFNIFHKLAHSPVVFQTLVAATRATLHDTRLDPVLRELAICTVTRITGATYPHHQHTGAARRLGIDEAKLLALPVYQLHPAFSDQERAVMSFAEELTIRAGVSEELKQRVACFLSIEERVELSWAVGFYNAVARVASVCDVRIEDVRPESSPVSPRAEGGGSRNVTTDPTGAAG